jgi:spore coat polysaccharide biosynthesis protein SpsF
VVSTMSVVARESLHQAVSTDSLRVVAIVQARMGSTRLPGKVLKEIRGVPALALQVGRVLESVEVAELCIATSDRVVDDPIVALAQDLGVACVRGSERDVLSRFAKAARRTSADVVVRLTADCPFHDWRVIDRAVSTFKRSSVDYLTNALKRTYPVGLDCEVMSATALFDADEHAKSEVEREHVTPYLYRHGRDHHVASFELPVDLSSLRWTLDTADDLRALRSIAERLPGDSWSASSWTDILAVVLNDSSLASINRHVEHRHLST